MADEAEKKKIELRVDNPEPGRHDSFYGLVLPSGSIETDLEYIRWHIEFRRRCANQGFDNLLELLSKTAEALKKPVTESDK